MGHVYGSITILIIASLIYKAIISQKKNEEIIKRNVFFANIDWYVYVVTFYSLLPRLFLRKDLFQPSNLAMTNVTSPAVHEDWAAKEEALRLLKLFLFDYHQSIRSLMYILGIGSFLISLKIGFIKY